MAIYQKSGVDVNVLDNPNIINTAGVREVPAIIGMGPSTIVVTDEAVTRGTGSTDTMNVNGATLLTITKVAKAPGVLSGTPSYALVSANGNLFQSASASITAPDKIAWVGSGVDIPSAGTPYYISYTYTPLSSQYDPTEFYDKETLKAKYGEESATTGILSIAGSIALENGSPSVIVVQASGSSYSEANYKTAIDKLQKKSNISEIVVVFPSGSVTRSNQESLLAYAFSHIQLMGTREKERGLVSGSPSNYFASSGGIEDNGATEITDHTTRAAALKSRNHMYVVPARIKRKDANDIYMELDGNFAAAGIAGVRAAREKKSTPVHGFTVVGFEVENTKWTDIQMDQLGAGNCLVLESNSNVVTMRDCITTDPTSADTQEPSVVDTQRLVKKTLRNTLKNTYTNKGKVITSTTVNDVVATTISVLSTLVNDNEIKAYGQQDNPLTGEIKVNAKQNTSEPRKIDVTCSYAPLFPLKFVSISVSTYI